MRGIRKRLNKFPGMQIEHMDPWFIRESKEAWVDSMKVDISKICIKDISIPFKCICLFIKAR